jgi:ABC-2 type transport system permease protein
VITVELIKQLRRPRSWIVLSVLALVAVVVTVIIGLTSAGAPERIGNWGSVVPDSSGFTMGLIGLNALLLFLIPLAVAIFAGASVADDAGTGSLRYLLARPVTRERALTSKAVVAAVFSLAAVALVVVAGVLSGLAAFGWHPLSVLDLQHSTPFSSGLSTMAPAEALGRLGLAVVVVAGTMLSTFAFALFCSTVTDRAFSAVAGGVLFGLVSRALDNIPGLHALSPWLPLTDTGTDAWNGLFFQPTEWSSLPHLAIVQGVYTVVLLSAAYLVFHRRDVLS